MEKPKFCVGELVELKSVRCPGLNCSITEILYSEPFKGFTCKPKVFYSGWIYRLCANNDYWCETALRKLPPDPDQSFDSMMKRLTKEKVPEHVHEIS